jgi:hypothetical protein
MPPHLPSLPPGLCICRDLNCKIPFGECHCGCGEKTTIAKYHFPHNGYFKGMPARYIKGHQGRIRPVIEEAQPFKIDGVYCRLIPLSQTLFAIVWESDYLWLMQWKWYARKARIGKPGYYAFRNIWDSDGNGKHAVPSMHSEIADRYGLPALDHADGCGLNNTQGNLRPCNASQNGANRGKTCNNKTGFKGVRTNKNSVGYRSRLAYMGREYFLGSYEKSETAARAYDRKALELFGDFARLNFPNERDQRLAEIELAKKEAA